MEHICMDILRLLVNTPNGNCIWEDPFGKGKLSIPDMANKLHVDIETINQNFAFLEHSGYIEYVNEPYCGYRITYRGKYFIEFQKDPPDNQVVLDFSQIELSEPEIDLLNVLRGPRGISEFPKEQLRFNRPLYVYRLIYLGLAESYREHIFPMTKPVQHTEPVQHTKPIFPTVTDVGFLVLDETPEFRPRKVCNGESGSYIDENGRTIKWETKYVTTTRGRDYLSYIEGRTLSAEYAAKAAKKRSQTSNLIATVALIIALLAWLFPGGLHSLLGFLGL